MLVFRAFFIKSILYMILVVDSGSTKCDWIAVDSKGNQLFDKIRTEGLNPAILSEEELAERIGESSVLTENKEKVTHVYFYGAGCGTEIPKKSLDGVLHSIFSKAIEIVVEEDTLAAVYSTINNETEAAVVCIMGTGSNCSYFDGSKLHQRVLSLGYTLMDDASGNYYGKELIKGYYFKHMPESLRELFSKEYNLEADVIKHNLYKEENPNAYLATFAKFMFAHKENPYMRELIKEGVRVFSKNMILQFKEELKNIPVHFAGSVAYFAQEEIKEVAQELGYKVGNFTRRPIEGLVTYHINKLK